MISLWILAILVVFALGLGRRAMMNLRIARYQKDKLKASCLARAGIKQGIAGLDTALKEGSQLEFTLGITNEESKININTASRELLAGLLAYHNIENPENIADLIRDWIDSDATTSEGNPENSIFKNAALSAPEELLLALQYFYAQNIEPEEARLKALETFNKIKSQITLWGEKYNINTIPEETLVIVMESIASAEEKSLAPAFASAIIYLREAQPNQAFARISGITLPEQQYTNLLSLLTNGDKFSLDLKFFKIDSQGSLGNIAKNITVVYNKTDNRIIYRREN